MPNYYTVIGDVTKMTEQDKTSAKEVEITDLGDTLYAGLPKDEIDPTVNPTEAMKAAAMHLYVEDAFKPTSDNVIAEMKQRDREEDATLKNVLHKIRKIDKEYPEVNVLRRHNPRKPRTRFEKIAVYVISKVGGFTINVMDRINRGLSKRA